MMSTSRSTSLSTSAPPSNPWALMPLLLFLILFVGSGLYFSWQGIPNAFYQISAAVAILPAVALSLFIGRGPYEDKFEDFIEGVRDPNIITMCLIYLMAGAFAAVTSGIGSIDSTVNLGLSFIPATLILPGIFLIAALLATAMGTSMGVIAAVGPLAFGISNQADIHCGWCMGAVLSGAMFGDNLSLISDTTIASVKTQGAKFKEKFILNAYFAVPAMVLTLTVFYLVSPEARELSIGNYNLIKVLPYIIILVLALLGMNVLGVLGIGIVSGLLIGLTTQDSYTISQFAGQISQGFISMHEILVLSLLIGGLSFLTNKQGGLEFLVHGVEKIALKLRNKTQSRRIGEMSISIIGSFADICTANNTVAIILSGNIAKKLARKHGVSPERSACLLDIFTCVFQGLLPYSAQVLLASSISGLSPLEIVTHVVYCPILGMVAMVGIIWIKSENVKNKVKVGT